MKIIDRIDNYLFKYINKIDICTKVKLFLSWSAAVIITIGVIVVLGNYLLSTFQSFRGPSKFYFWIFLFVSFFSKRLSIGLLIFSLPLMPNFHTQLEYITNPGVKYFFVYPGIDAITGLIVGNQIRFWADQKKFILAYHMPAWEFGLFLIVLIISTVLAVSRNLWQTASKFSVADLINNIFNFKLVGKLSDYLPITELIVFAIGIGLIIALMEIFKTINNPEDIIFKPLALSILLSGILGIIQAITSFGLGIETTSIRSDSLGYGAIGFQPDIHAYAGIMCIGAVGLLGYFRSIESKKWQYIFIITIGLSWIAIVLSKSRASIILSLIMATIIIFIGLKKKINNKKIFFSFLLSIFIGASFLIIKNETTTELINLYTLNKQLFIERINLLSSWRYDLHMATLRMWMQFPMLGLGVGNLFRVSSIYEFSGSALMPRLGGENTHNYFLQLLAEIGLLGFLCLAIILIKPYCKKTDRPKLNNIYIAIFSVFLGNIYSHSLILRENLYLLLIFIAALYIPNLNSYSRHELNKGNVLKSRYLTIKFILSIITIIFVIQIFIYEIIKAYQDNPYKYGRDCYRFSTKPNSTWQNGRFVKEVSSDVKGIELEIQAKLNSLSYLKLPIKLELFDKKRNIVITDNVRVDDGDQIKFKIRLPDETRIGSEGGVVVLSFSDCLTDKEYNLKANLREIPLIIKNVDLLIN